LVARGQRGKPRLRIERHLVPISRSTERSWSSQRHDR
jgi:hypothetical protein